MKYKIWGENAVNIKPNHNGYFGRGRFGIKITFLIPQQFNTGAISHTNRDKSNFILLANTSINVYTNSFTIHRDK